LDPDRLEDYESRGGLYSTVSSFLQPRGEWWGHHFRTSSLP